MLCREQTNEEKVVLFADSHDTLFQGGTLVCPSATTYADMYWSHEADVILQADGVTTASCNSAVRFCLEAYFDRASHACIRTKVPLSNKSCLCTTYCFLSYSMKTSTYGLHCCPCPGMWLGFIKNLWIVSACREAFSELRRHPVISRRSQNPARRELWRSRGQRRAL